LDYGGSMLSLETRHAKSILNVCSGHIAAHWRPFLQRLLLPPIPEITLATVILGKNSFKLL
jgi:hypothetical protein